MFDLIRNNTKVLMALLMLLIIPSFVFFGIEGYTRFRDTSEPVARIGSERITRTEWEAAHRREVEQIAASMPGVDRALLESDTSRRATLERMVDERVLARAAQDQRLTASDRRVAQELLRIPAIAQLRQEDGTLDMQRYRELLRAQGMTPESFEAGVRADLARTAVLRTVADSAFAGSTATRLAMAAFFEQREVAWAMFRPADFAAGVRVEEADLRAHYEAHADDYRSPEQAEVEYLLLDPETLAARVAVSEQELRDYYRHNVADTSRAEQRRAAHILLQLDPKANAEERARVRAQAERLLQQVRANPQRFAELARQHSQDPGSAARGGDLDWFGRGAMVKPFEEAVFALRKGEISDIVETEFGLHIIQLLDVRQPQPESFESARPRLEAQLRRQMAQRRFAEEAERFSNLVYEQPDSLTPAAEALGLRVRRATVERTGPVEAADETARAIFREPAVLRAIFQEEALASKRNSAAIELSGNRLVAVRVVQHRPAQRRPFEAVVADVRTALVAQRAQAAALEAARARHAQWSAQGPGASELRAAVLVSRQQPQGLPLPALRAALSAPLEGEAPAWLLVDLGTEGAAVLRVRRGPPRAQPDPAQGQREKAELARLLGEGESQAYLKALRQRYRAEVLAR